ncbi:hypothetical protein ACFQGX_20120 [Nonomuraea dietziae]|uniref:hypothetical protein n=1 Tax=Nonomuraea dietziae TaxID=65515 RepID=UPI00360ED980
MKVEEGLAEAMAARVADVQAPSTMGGSVRRRHRRHVIRFRVAGRPRDRRPGGGGVPWSCR